MRPSIRFVALSSLAGCTLALVAACATGQELAESAGAVIVEADSGSAAASIRIDAAPKPTVVETPDTGTPPANDAAVQADTAPPPPPPPPPPATPACPSSDSVLVIALLLAGTPLPACNAGACGTGQCCYSNQYCLPQ